MDELVQRLADGEHAVAIERAEGKVEEFKAMIDRDYVLVKFTETRGGTELGMKLDRDNSNLDGANWDEGKGEVKIQGNLNLNYVDVACVATIDLSNLKGKGHLVVLESQEATD